MSQLCDLSVESLAHSHCTAYTLKNIMHSEWIFYTFGNTSALDYIILPYNKVMCCSHYQTHLRSRLTFWGRSPRLPCCTCGSSRQTIWWQCSWTSWQSWRCRLCKASPLGSGFLLAGNPASGPRPIPAGHTLSCFPPASADRLPYLEAGEAEEEILINVPIF